MRLTFFAKIEISLLLATILVTSAPLVNAQSPDFGVGANPSSRCITVGSTATYQITVASIDGFSGQVLLGDDIQPSVNNGPTLSPIPSSVTLTSNQNATFDLSAATTSSTPSQVYTITVAGIAGSTLHSTSVYLAFAPGCGAVGGVISPANMLSSATPFIGFAVIISAIAGAASFAFIHTKQKRTTKNQLATAA